MSKPTPTQLAEMMGPQEEVPGQVNIPGYGRIQQDKAKREVITRLRMIADALEDGKTVPISALNIAVDFMKNIPTDDLGTSAAE